MKDFTERSVIISRYTIPCQVFFFASVKCSLHGRGFLGGKLSKRCYARKGLSWLKMLLQLTLLRRCGNGACITRVLEVVADGFGLYPFSNMQAIHSLT